MGTEITIIQSKSLSTTWKRVSVEDIEKVRAFPLTREKEEV